MCRIVLSGSGFNSHDISYGPALVTHGILACRSPKRILELLLANLIGLDLMNGKMLDRLLNLLTALLAPGGSMRSDCPQITFRIRILLLLD